MHLPGGAVAGAMLPTVQFNIAQPVRAVMPVGLEVTVQITVGVRIGLSAARALPPMLQTVLPLTLMGALCLMALGFSLAALAVRMGWLDAAAALFGFTPGGISVMSLVASEKAGKPRSWPPCTSCGW